MQQTFTTGGLLLTPGTSYFAFISASPSNGAGGRSIILTGGNTYANGSIFSTPSSTFSTDGQDLAFVAQFGQTGPTSTVPEPSTVALFGAGMLTIAAVSRRRRKGRLPLTGT